MTRTVDTTEIPDKLFFKIGEVCEIVDVQAHVLRYWETEFPMLSPQKNQSGQRSYRRKDVEVALKIKKLLYNEMFTIAGARKKLQSDAREGSKPKPAAAPPPPPVAEVSHPDDIAPLLFDAGFETKGASNGEAIEGEKQKEALKTLARHLLELREMLKD